MALRVLSGSKSNLSHKLYGAIYTTINATILYSDYSQNDLTRTGTCVRPVFGPKPNSDLWSDLDLGRTSTSLGPVGRT